MPRTKPAQHSAPATPAELNGPTAEIMTLGEAAAFLRLPAAEVLRLIREQDLPGRLAGTEWRFLKSAIQDWLSKPIPTPSKEAQLAVAGAWKDDPYVEHELKEIYQRRSRSITAGEE